MRTNKFAVVLASLFILCGTAFSETAAGLIQKAKDKSAGVQQNVKDIKIVSVSVMEMEGKSMTVTSNICQKGKKIRIDASSIFPGTKEEMETVMIYDGKTTWMLSPTAGKQRMEGKAIGLNAISEEEEWWVKLAADIELKGEEKVGEIECYILESKTSQNIGKVWIGKKDFVLVKAAGEDELSGKFEVISSDFKDAGFGWMLSYKTVMKNDKGVTMSSTVKSVEVNKGLKDEFFDPLAVDTEKLKMPKVE